MLICRLFVLQEKKGKENDNANIPSLVMKTVFWMLTTFTLVVLSSFLLPGDNTQNEVKIHNIYIFSTTDSHRVAKSSIT